MPHIINSLKQVGTIVGRPSRCATGSRPVAISRRRAPRLCVIKQPGAPSAGPYSPRRRSGWYGTIGRRRGTLWEARFGNEEDLRVRRAAYSLDAVAAAAAAGQWDVSYISAFPGLRRFVYSVRKGAGRRVEIIRVTAGIVSIKLEIRQQQVAYTIHTSN